MDALIAHLRATGTGQTKINAVVQAAAGRSIGECYRDVCAALDKAGYEGTSQKVATWLVEHQPDLLSSPPTRTPSHAGESKVDHTAESKADRKRRRFNDTETVLVPDPASTR